MSKDKENPLYQAFINKDYETIKELLASENAKELVHSFDLEKSALHFAAENGYTSLLKRIIDLGILPNIVDLDGNTPLHIAADNGHIDSIREFISQGSNIIVQNYKGNTPLHWVALDNRIDSLIALLKLGANIEIKNNEGDTPLHYAADSGYINNVKELLKRGANIEAQNDSGDTPLHVAAEKEHIYTLIELLKQGANIEAHNQENETALDKAISSKSLDTTILLLNKGAKISNNPYATPLIQSSLNAALLIDNLYSAKKTENALEPLMVNHNIDNDQIIGLLPRLESLIRKYGMPHHLFNPNNIPEFIRKSVNEMIHSIKTTDQIIQEIIELHLAIILNKQYPEEFPSQLPYSQALKYLNQTSDTAICSHMLVSYKQKPYFQPKAFFNYMLNPSNQAEILNLFIPCYNEINIMLEEIEKLVLPKNQLVLFNNFKEAFHSPLTKDKHLLYVADKLNKAVESIDRQTQIIEQLETNIGNQQKTIDDQQKKIASLEAENPRFQDRIAVERIQAKQPKIESFFIKKSTAGTKRKAESNIEFIENQRDSQITKFQERGI